MHPDRDIGDAIERRVVANPTMIADHHFPRESNTNAWSNQNAATDFGAE